MNPSGSPVDFLAAFFGGVLLSLTPCIYPLLPITIAYIGASSANSKVKGFSLSFIYVTGISITYAALGIAAVWTGTIFGRFSSLPLVRIIAGLIIIFFGISLWDGRGINLPFFKLPVNNRLSPYLSCLILGLTSGLVISPCTAPVLGSILTFVAVKRNFIYGALLLLTFAYGMGMLLILAGTFSSILAKLPKTGRWMKVMSRICAIILILGGIYFVFSGLNYLAPLDLSSKFSMQELSLSGTAYAQEQEAIPAPDFILKDLKGDMVTLSEFQDKKPVILFFWAIGCSICVEELSHLNEMFPTIDSQGIEFLAINVFESENMVRRFFREDPSPFQVLLDSDGYVALSYGVIGVPTFVLINKEGEIVFYHNYFPRQYKEYLSQQ